MFCLVFPSSNFFSFHFFSFSQHKDIKMSRPIQKTQPNQPNPILFLYDWLTWKCMLVFEKHLDSLTSCWHILSSFIFNDFKSVSPLPNPQILVFEFDWFLKFLNSIGFWIWWSFNKTRQTPSLIIKYKNLVKQHMMFTVLSCFELAPLLSSWVGRTVYPPPDCTCTT